MSTKGLLWALPVFGLAALCFVSRPAVVRAANDDQGRHAKYDLFGAATDTHDPHNHANDVLGIDSNSSPNFGGAQVKLPDGGVKIDALTDRLSLKYYLAPDRTACYCGAPRISLAIDPGNGSGVKEIFGYVGAAPFGVGCTVGAWTFQDLTDNVGRWDVSKFGGPMTDNWDQVLTFFDSKFPNHEVLTGFLDDDGCAGCGVSAGNPACGQAFYDLITIDNATWQNDHNNTGPQDGGD